MLYQIIDSNTLKSSSELTMLPTGEPCSNITTWLEEHPEAQTQYGWYHLDNSAIPPETGTYRQRYELINNVIVMSWEEYELPHETVQPIELNRDKLRNWLISVGKSDWLTTKMTEERFCTFWYAEMRYVPGSYMAELIKTEMNISQQELESIVDSCKN